MRAYRLDDFTSLDDLHLHEEVESRPQRGEVLVRIPDHLTYEEASTLPCAGLTAWTVLSEGAAIRLGDTVLVLGTAGVSIFSLQLAVVWGERVRALSLGGVDRIVDVGGPGTMVQSLRAIRPGGETALIGFVSPEGGGIDFIDMFISGATLRHNAVGNREGLQALGRAVEMAGIKPVIDCVFDFDDAKAAFVHLISASHIGNVVVRCAAAVA